MAVPIREDVPVGVRIQDGMMDMHCGAGLVLDRLGHESGEAIVPVSGFPDKPFEIKDLIRQSDGFAMTQVDLDLPAPPS